MQIYIHMHKYIDTTYVYTSIHAYIHTCHTSIHTDKHTSIHTCTQTRTQVLSPHKRNAMLVIAQHGPGLQVHNVLNILKHNLRIQLSDDVLRTKRQLKRQILSQTSSMPPESNRSAPPYVVALTIHTSKEKSMMKSRSTQTHSVRTACLVLVVAANLGRDRPLTYKHTDTHTHICKPTETHANKGTHLALHMMLVVCALKGLVLSGEEGHPSLMLLPLELHALCTDEEIIILNTTTAIAC
jgi:hypothetical protein